MEKNKEINIGAHTANSNILRIRAITLYYSYKYNTLRMNNTELITPKETLRNMSRVQDIFRELDQESREILLRFLARKYEVEL